MVNFVEGRGQVGIDDICLRFFGKAVSNIRCEAQEISSGGSARDEFVLRFVQVCLQ